MVAPLEAWRPDIAAFAWPGLRSRLRLSIDAWEDKSDKVEVDVDNTFVAAIRFDVTSEQDVQEALVLPTRTPTVVVDAMRVRR